MADVIRFLGTENAYTPDMGTVLGTSTTTTTIKEKD